MKIKRRRRRRRRREKANSGTNVETVDYFCVIQNSPQKQSLHRVKTKQKKSIHAASSSQVRERERKRERRVLTFQFIIGKKSYLSSTFKKGKRERELYEMLV